MKYSQQELPDQESSDLFPQVEALINVFKNKLGLRAASDMVVIEEPYDGYTWYFLSSINWTKEMLIKVLKKNSNLIL